MTSADLANDIATELQKGNLYVFLRIALLAPVISFAAYIAFYFQTRAKIKAELDTFSKTLEIEVKKMEALEQAKLKVSDSHFQELLRQQTKTTQEIENVKTSISRTDWAHKELTTIKIKKIEELVTAVMNTEQMLSQMQDKAILGEEIELKKRIRFEVLSVAAELYLPEIKQEVQNFIKCARDIDIETFQNHCLLLNDISEVERKAIVSTIYDTQKQSELWTLRNILVESARQLMERLYVQN